MSRAVVLSVWMSLSCLVAANNAAEAPKYVVVVAQKTADDPAWQKVCDALVKKHAGEVIRYEKSPAETLAQLQNVHPRYVCFVAPPAEAGRAFVADVHRLTRSIDDDPERPLGPMLQQQHHGLREVGVVQDGLGDQERTGQRGHGTLRSAHADRPRACRFSVTNSRW